MLNTFPLLLAYGLVAPFIIRITLGLLYLSAGYIKTFARRETCISMFRELGSTKPLFFVLTVGILELLGGVCLILGFKTQVAAIALSLLALGFLVIKLRRRDVLKQGVSFYVLVLAMSLSLLFSGAGFLAIDLPL